MRRSNCNENSRQQGRLPTVVFHMFVTIALVYHCTHLLSQFKSIPLPQSAHAWNVANKRATTQKHVKSFGTSIKSVPNFYTLRKYQLRSHKCNVPSNGELDGKLDSISCRVQRASTSFVLGTSILCSAMATTGVVHPAIANGYDDYISEPVQIAIKAVQDADTNDALVKAYESIAEIITEGKGVGGSINFQGVQLDRGYVSDEDTSIYNPGLTLLTETEKTRLVDTVVESKKQQLITSGSTPDSNWNGDLEAGYSFLRDRLDPLHMYELKGYLSILPIVGAIMYVVTLAIQQLSRDIFPIAYIICASLVFAPIIVLVLLGPQ